MTCCFRVFFCPVESYFYGMSLLPPPLSKGDQIVVTAPSRRIFEEQVEKAWTIFDSWGLEVTRAPHLFSADGYFAGTDKERLADFQSALNDQSVRAIFCARGGYGATRFVDQMQWPISGPPKWVIGFSDVTAIHLSAARAGWATVHGLMPAQYGYDGVDESLRSLHDLLFYHSFSREMPSKEALTIPGSTTAPVIGGNLSLLAESLGTRTELDTSGKILFMEEVDEYLYKVDRMLNQLQRAGKFDNLAGVIIGDFSDMNDTEIPFGTDIYGVLSRYFNDKQIPVASGLPIGHERFNLALPLMTPVSIEVSQNVCRLSLGQPS